MEGFPTYGDSGSGVLRRFPDGSLRHLGVASTGSDGDMRFVRTDTQATLLDELVDDTLMCGPLVAQGACRDNIAVRCDAQGFWSTDCGPSSEECQADGEGLAACVCPCDTEPFCQLDCVCDAECPCECDVSEGCDADCPCDAPCYDPPVVEPATEEGCAVSTDRAPGRDDSGGRWLLLGLVYIAAWRGRRVVGR